MKFETVTDVKPPKRATADQVEADLAIRAMRDTGRTLAVEVDAETDPKTLRLRLAHAATRAGVKVSTWYSVDDAKVYAQLK